MNSPRLRRAGAPVLAALLVLAGCKDATLGPSSSGEIQGQVLEYDTGVSIAGASITTTPPSEALLTQSDGSFRVQDLEVGTYQLSARKSGFKPTSVAVAVREGRITNAVVFLEREYADPAAAVTALNVEVLSFWNTQASDSTFVEAEFRVRNSGDVAVDAYEVYFRIETTGDTYFHDEGAGALSVGESNVRRFRTYIRQSPATDVRVDGIWSDPPITPSA